LDRLRDVSTPATIENIGDEDKAVREIMPKRANSRLHGAGRRLHRVLRMWSGSSFRTAYGKPTGGNGWTSFELAGILAAEGGRKSEMAKMGGCCTT